MSNQLFFSVGEPSGDLHAARLAKKLRQLAPAIHCRGFGGEHMRREGCDLDFPLTDLAVVGFTEVLPNLRKFFRVADQASAIFEAERPDAVLLVDFPGFNWHIAKRAKRLGIPVFYFLPPQLWAWGGWRIHKMKRWVDHVICNLPMEKQWFEQHDMPVSYVGHPFFDEVAERELDARFLNQWAEHDGCQVAVLPGSRSREVTGIWPMQLSAIRELAARNPKTRFLVACLKDTHCVWCQRQLTAADRKLDIQFFVGKTSEVIEVADCSLMKSGSVSLEMVARTTPSVVVYHVGRTLYEIGRRLSNLKSFTLPNLITGQTIMPEFLAVGRSKSATIEQVVAAMDRLLADPDERARQRADLIDLRADFGRPGATQRAAELITNELGWAKPRQFGKGSLAEYEPPKSGLAEREPQQAA